MPQQPHTEHLNLQAHRAALKESYQPLPGDEKPTQLQVRSTSPACFPFCAPLDEKCQLGFQLPAAVMLLSLVCDSASAFKNTGDGRVLTCSEFLFFFFPPQSASFPFFGGYWLRFQRLFSIQNKHSINNTQSLKKKNTFSQTIAFHIQNGPYVFKQP